MLQPLQYKRRLLNSDSIKALKAATLCIEWEKHQAQRENEIFSLTELRETWRRRIRLPIGIDPVNK